MFERFTAQARATVVEAGRVAEETKSPVIGREHLIVALATCAEPTLIAVGPSTADLTERLAHLSPAGQEEADAEALGAIGIDLPAIKKAVAQRFGPEAWNDGAPTRRPPGGLIGRLLPNPRGFTPGAKKAIELALREALVDNAREITATHLLRGILRDPGPEVAALLPGTTLDQLRARLAERAA